MDEDMIWVYIFLVALCGWLVISHIGATNNGQHTGYITAVEQEGIIWKTWRAYIKTDPQSSQEDNYCVKDDLTAQLLKNFEDSRELVTVSYSSPFIVFNWQCGGEDSIIDSAYPVNN